MQRVARPRDVLRDERVVEVVARPDRVDGRGVGHPAVGGEGIEPPSSRQCLLQHHQAVSAIALHRAAVIVNLHRVGLGKRQRILHGEAIPLWMRDAQERTGRCCASRHGLHGLALAPWCEIERQAHRHHVPVMALGGDRRVNLGAEQCGESLRAQRARVRDRIAVAGPEVIGQREEVIARVLVEAGDGLRREPAVGARGMGVQVAAPEPARLGEGGHAHWCGSIPRGYCRAVGPAGSLAGLGSAAARFVGSARLVAGAAVCAFGAACASADWASFEALTASATAISSS